MGFLPIAASLIASHISATTLLALQAEIYSNGSVHLEHWISDTGKFIRILRIFKIFEIKDENFLIKTLPKF